VPITPTNPFKGRQFPGEVIILCVRWYLRYPLAYEHVAELLAERGVAVDPTLRANIDETVLPVVITEQGENRNQCEEQRYFLGFSHGFACR